MFTVLNILATFELCTINSDTAVQNQIVVLQEENQKIEKDVMEMVENYIAYEGNTFKDLKLDGDANILITTLYPELKSNKLVEKQLDTYIQNSTEVKELKKKVAGLSAKRWIGYFGK